MQNQYTQTRLDLLAVIEEVKSKKLQESHGVPVKLSPLDEIVDGMIGNASINLYGVSVENVFANWRCAQDAVDVYANPETNPDARPPSKREFKLLDRYISDAKAITINSTDNSARVIATDGGLILQLGNYAHDYWDEDDAARDWNEFMKMRSTDGWEGHDSLSADVIVDESALMHGIREFSEEEVSEFVKSGLPESGPANFRLFIEALREPLQIDRVHQLGKAIVNSDLESALKIADLIGSREEIDAVAEDHDITMSDRKYLKLIAPESVLRRLDELVEVRFLSTMNADLSAAECRPANPDNYGDPFQWEPGLTIEEIDRSGHACAAGFIEDEKLAGPTE